MYLIGAGAGSNVEVRHLAGEQPAMLTPLQFAARAGFADVARALLAAGANANAGRDGGVPTPLHFAAGEGHLDTVRVLLASGADLSARDRAFHATAAGWAEFGGHAEIATLLSRRLGISVSAVSAPVVFPRSSAAEIRPTRLPVRIQSPSAAAVLVPGGSTSGIPRIGLP